jgi:hypothetical protein
VNKLPCCLALVICAWANALCQAHDASENSASKDFSPQVVRRFALIIGAQHYNHLAPATNALNDALEVVKVLKQANFSSIRFLPDPRDEVEIANYIKNVHDWSGDSNQPAIIVFFYAGHGFMSKERRPYLVPVNARPDHLLEDGVPLSSVLSDLSFHHSGISFFLFDACRTGLSDSSPNTEGVTPLGPQPAVPGLRAETYIQFATSEGAAAQSSGRVNSNNSPFTNELITYFPRPAASARWVFDKVHTWVPIHTDSSQFTVEVGDAVLTNLYMLPNDPQQSADKAAWLNAVATNLNDCVKEFITQYPGSPYLYSALHWHPSNRAIANLGGAYACETH